MSRYIKTIALPPVDLKHIAERATEYLLSEGYKSVRYKRGGLFFKKAGSLSKGPKYIKFGFKTGEMTIEAFVKFPLLPGITVGEMGTSGSFCSVMKTDLLKDISSFETNVGRITEEFLRDNPGPRQYPDIRCTMN